MYVIASIVVSGLFVSRAWQQLKLDALGIAVCAIVSALIGSRVFFLLQQWLLMPGLRVEPIGDGTASWGAYLGGCVGLVAYSRARRLRFAPFADVVASCLGLAVLLGRIGCYLNGDDYGRLTTSAIGVRYPPGSYPYNAQLMAGLIPPNSTTSLTVHPVQLYLALLGLILFVIVNWLRPQLAGRPGATFASYWVLYCPGRFVLEFFRGDQTRFIHGFLSVPQILSVMTLIPTIFVLIHLLGDSSDRLVEPDSSA
jgi:phosphatidylglycerol:prolipoprotein diacylglycerol transferase